MTTFHSFRSAAAIAQFYFTRNYQRGTKPALVTGSQKLNSDKLIKFSRSFHTSVTASSTTSSSSENNFPPYPKKFSYKVAASYVAKNRYFNFKRDISHLKLPGPNSPRELSPIKKQFNPQSHARPASGQDAFFFSQIGDTSDVALGIADGVGGWAELGIDPADFSHGICHYMKYAADTYRKEEWGSNLCAQALLQRGYEDLYEDQSVLAGGSTACVAIARSNGILDTANLGDSGYVQIRLNTIHSCSEPQVHDFNTPYQLSIIPEVTRRRVAAFGRPYLCDLPHDADINQHKLKHGDVLVMGTDGVWDNLSHPEILKIVSQNMLCAKAWVHTSSNEISVAKNFSQNVSIIPADEEAISSMPSNLQGILAIKITAEAKAASVNVNKDSPFSRELRKFFPRENWKGGKVDDICVVVAIVCEEDVY
ncbi:hypothetical protein Golomagni_00849 [Golovinomyces magnicellulatus]|nr:hypothetical protein Golomagni_00849 [Golovinomyces magnicellulatus]